MRKWQYEITVRKMVCILCGDPIPPRSRVPVSTFRTKPIVLCHPCEQACKPRLGKIDPDPILTILGGYACK